MQIISHRELETAKRNVDAILDGNLGKEKERGNRRSGGELE